MKISFYGTDEESYHATMRRLDFKTALDNIRDFVRLRKELNKRDAQVDPSIHPAEKPMGPRQRSSSLFGALSWTKEPATV
jgi:hypothetical protein